MIKIPFGGGTPARMRRGERVGRKAAEEVFRKVVRSTRCLL